MRLALVGSAGLLVLGMAAFWFASNRADKAPYVTDGHAVTVTIRGKVCEPNAITVPAGRTTFTIVNATERALEWEILDGVMVIDERENIAPGLRQTMTVKLEPGDYDITCGLLNNPRGRLHVTPSAAEAARPSVTAYVGPLAEYQVYLLTEAETLDGATQDLAAALRAGQLDKARALYAQAHAAYARIEAAAQLFGDLDTRINARPEYFDKREADPAFAGFRRIEHGLGAGQTTALAGVGDRLVQDIATLQERLAVLTLKPEQLAGLTEQQLRGLAGSLAAPATASDEPAQLQAALDGSRKVVELLSPLLAKADPKLDATLKGDVETFDKELAPWRTADGVRTGSLSVEQRQALTKIVGKLANDLAKANAALGLS